jgi:hypothetical protein
LGITTISAGLTAERLLIARLQAQADSAALAAEDVLRGFSVGFPCETAEQIVKEIGAALEECHKVNLDIFISVRSEDLGIVHKVHSQATPS